MNVKKVKNYSYEGFGFPIELDEVEMIFIDSDWHPKIDLQKLADEVIVKIAIQESRLTGSQVKFIRNYYSMSLRDFAQKVVHESHMAVSKWEKKGDLITNMNTNTEHELRLYIIENIHKKNRESKSKFYDVYMATKRFISSTGNGANIIHAHA
jgi:DNA-binding transcriptional regulator YiaG